MEPILAMGLLGAARTALNHILPQSAPAAASGNEGFEAALDKAASPQERALLARLGEMGVAAPADIDGAAASLASQLASAPEAAHLREEIVRDGSFSLTAHEDGWRIESSSGKSAIISASSESAGLADNLALLNTIRSALRDNPGLSLPQAASSAKSPSNEGLSANAAWHVFIN